MKTSIVAAVLGLAACLPVWGAPAAGIDGGEPARLVHQQGFEKAGKAPAKVWSTNASYEVHQLAAIEDPTAPEGSHSLKIDVTLKSGSYFYLLGPMRVRPEGPLALEGRVHLSEPLPAGIQMKFGVGYDDPAARTKGSVKWDKTAKISGGSGDWLTLKTDLGWLAGVSEVAHTQGWALLVTGKFNGQRLTLTVDDIQLRGKVVANLEGVLATWREKNAGAAGGDAAAQQTPAIPAGAAQPR